MIVLESNYSKKIGLPGYSSHQFSITLKTEIADLAQVQTESDRLYKLLQTSVDASIKEVGFLPSEVPIQNRNGNGNGRDTGEIELACEELKVGWQDEQALYIHRSVLDELPPVLRAYVGCATALFGDISQTDVIKLHKASGKVTFLGYDDFEGKPLPELRNRIKVNMRTRWVQVFDHSADGQLLYFKERFVGLNHPLRAEMEAFSAKLRKLGLSDTELMGPTKAEFSALLNKHGFNENVNKKRRRTVACGKESAADKQRRRKAQMPWDGSQSSSQSQLSALTQIETSKS